LLGSRVRGNAGLGVVYREADASGSPKGQRNREEQKRNQGTDVAPLAFIFCHLSFVRQMIWL